MYRLGISLGGVSKTLGLPGLRLGWLASRAEWTQHSQQKAEAGGTAGLAGGSSSIDGGTASNGGTVAVLLQQRIRELKDYTTICSSAPSEVGVWGRRGMMDAGRGGGEALIMAPCAEDADWLAICDRLAAYSVAFHTPHCPGRGVRSEECGALFRLLPADFSFPQAIVARSWIFGTLSLTVPQAGMVCDWRGVTQPKPMLLQVLALMALRAGETIRAGHMAVLRANLVHAEAFFAEFAYMFEWQPPAAGSVAFPR